MTILEDRVAALDALILQSGGHRSFDQGVCVMEAVAWVAGEPFSDHPPCASRVIGEFLRSWNDAMNDDDRQMLKPLIPRLVGTAADDATELRRSYMALDWYCRVSTPAWLRLAGLVAEAEAIEATAPIVDSASGMAAHDALNKGKQAAEAAESAAESAALSAAWSAAESAALSVAESAALSVAESAAWSAALSAALNNLRPIVVTLQASALELAEKMISAGSQP